jgi:hypothetical protein
MVMVPDVGDLGEGSGDDSRLSVAIPGSHMCPDMRDEEKRRKKKKKTLQPNKNPRTQTPSERL